MAEERIDIEVTDRGADKAANNLRRIADEADRGFTFVNKLKSALAGINPSYVLKLAQAASSHTSALARQTAAQARATTATAAAAVATAKAATEQQRLATETAKTAAAQARADSAQNAAAASALRLANATQRAAESKGNLYNRANALRSSLDPQYAAQMRFNAEIGEANALLKGGAISMGVYQQAVAAADARLKNFSTSTMPQMTGAMGRGRMQTANIAAQFNDLGVQFAMAAQSGAPLRMMFMALIQQGSQLHYIASTMDGGFKGLIATVLRMAAPFVPIIALVTALGLALNSLKNATPDKEMENFAKTLGLTKKELEELKDVSVTWGDTLSATMDVLAERAGTSTDEIKSRFSSMWKSVGEFSKFSIAILLAAFGALVKGIASAVINLGKLIVNAFSKAFNLVIGAFETLVNGIIGGVNTAAGAMNKVFGTEIGELGKIELPKIEGKFDISNPLTDMRDQFKTTFNEVNAGFDEISRRAKENAKDRLREQAKDIIDDRTGKKGPKAKVDHTAERRAHALAMVNLELDKEISRMRMLKDERAIQQRMDQIEESLAQKKIQLNDAERASIRAKVTEIERFKYVQSEMDRILEDSIEPRRTLNASMEAANILLQRGAIDQARYNQELVKASRAYQEAVDPLFQMKEQLTAAENMLGKFGYAAQQAAYYEGIRQAKLKEGIVLSPQYVAGLDSEIDALMRRNNALLQGQALQNQVQGAVGGIVDPLAQDQRMLENKQMYYDALNAMADQYNLNEESRRQALGQLDLMFMEKRVEAARGMFSALASLSSSGNKKLAMIGKAAAMAQAAIDGALAVQKALASAPPPINFITAAAVGLSAAMNVAKIASTNVGSFKDGGQFMVGGRAGVDANNINMNVTRGERVTIENAQQQRANDNAPGSGPTIVPIKIINSIDGDEVMGMLDSGDYDHVILNAIDRNSNKVTTMVGGSNG